jgi:hypothetical protein
MTRKALSIKSPPTRSGPATLAPRRAAEIATLAPRRVRRASTVDHARVREFANRLEAGEDEVEAFWCVASDRRTGYARFRGSTVRPPETTLRRKLSALLARTVPGVVELVRNVSLARLAGLGDDAADAVGKIVRGEVTNPHVARARLDAARLILASVGVSERGSSVTVNNANVQNQLTVIDSILLKLDEGKSIDYRDSSLNRTFRNS